MSFFNVPRERNCELIDVQSLCVFIHNYNIRFQICHTKCRWDSSTPCGLPAWEITVDSKSTVHISQNKMKDVVMPPSIALCIQHYLTTVKNMVCCAFVTTEFAISIWKIFTSGYICRGWEGVYWSINHKFEGSRFELEHWGFPQNISLLLCCQGQVVALQLEALHMILQFILGSQSRSLSDLLLNVIIKFTFLLPLLNTCEDWDFTIRSIQLQGFPIISYLLTDPV